MEKGQKEPLMGTVRGIKTESSSETEGKVTFDIRFFAMTPQRERVKLIINVEAQNKFYPGYPLIKRAIYYNSRQMSAQYGQEFVHSHYGDIKKVYSIWICFNPPQERHNTITMYHIHEEQLVGDVHENVAYYDLMTEVMICLGTKTDERYTGVLKVLDVFTSKASSLADKSAALKSEFGTDMPARLLKKEALMCNYSDYVEEYGREEGRKEGKAEALFCLMNNLKITLDQALCSLSIPEAEWAEYRVLVNDLVAHSAS